MTSNKKTKTMGEPSRLTERIILSILIIAIIAYMLIQPSHNKDWITENTLLPKITFINQTHVEVQHIRNNSYFENGTTLYSWINRTYDITQIEKMWFIQEPFALWGASAHTFVTFGFTDGEYIAISIEARFEKNETYSPIKGLFKKYELWYLWATETDVIRFRTNILNASVQLYPINTTQQTMQDIFVEFAKYTKNLENKPEFYHTLTNTCTSSLAQRIDAVLPNRLGFTIARVLPGFSDARLYQLQIINTTLSFEEARKYYTITQKARDSSVEQFSENIRLQ